MSDKPRRAWFQIHLSTAIVLMFVAGGSLWANLRPKKVQTFDPPAGYASMCNIYGQIGWPYEFIQIKLNVFFVSEPPDEILMQHANQLFRETPVPPLSAFFSNNLESQLGPFYNFRGLMINVAVVLIILLSVAACSEQVLRRREARAP